MRHVLLGTRRHFRQTGRLKYREFATPATADGPLGRALAVADNVVALVRRMLLQGLE
jgi:hypothetical protein